MPIAQETRQGAVWVSTPDLVGTPLTSLEGTFVAGWLTAQSYVYHEGIKAIDLDFRWESGDQPWIKLAVVAVGRSGLLTPTAFTAPIQLPTLPLAAGEIPVITIPASTLPNNAFGVWALVSLTETGQYQIGARHVLSPDIRLRGGIQDVAVEIPLRTSPRYLKEQTEQEIDRTRSCAVDSLVYPSFVEKYNVPLDDAGIQEKLDKTTRTTAQNGVELPTVVAIQKSIEIATTPLNCEQHELPYYLSGGSCYDGQFKLGAPGRVTKYGTVDTDDAPEATGKSVSVMDCLLANLESGFAALSTIGDRPGRVIKLTGGLGSFLPNSESIKYPGLDYEKSAA